MTKDKPFKVPGAVHGDYFHIWTIRHPELETSKTIQKLLNQRELRVYKVETARTLVRQSPHFSEHITNGTLFVAFIPKDDYCYPIAQVDGKWTIIRL